VGLLMAGLIVWQMLIPRPYFTGTDSVGVSSIVANVAPGQELCVGGLELPADTGAVRLVLFAPRPTIEATITTISGSFKSVSRVSAPTSAAQAAVQARIPTTPGQPVSRPATVCMTPLGGAVGVGGSGNLQYGEQRPTIGPVGSFASAAGTVKKRSALALALAPGRVAVWFLPPHNGERSLLASLGAIFSRAALFRPGIVGPWTYPVLLFVVLPFTWLLSLLALSRAGAARELRFGGRRLRLALVIGLVAFLNAASWALITPAFNTPDEPDHFAYVQYLAETGHTPSKIAGARPPFSTDQTLAMNAVDTYSVVSEPDARPPWLKSDVRSWEQLRRGIGAHPRNNGGGYTPAASIHDPPYYALGAIAYLLVKGQSVFSQLTAVRLVSALLGALVAMCAFGIVRELVPKYPLAAVAAGLLVAYHPMFGFISAAVNDDSGVNAAAALSLYALVRALRRGLGWREGLALGGALAIAPLMKETGYEIYPAAAVGIAGLLWRDIRGRRARVDGSPASKRAPGRLRGWLALGGSFAAVLVTWAVIKPHVLDVAPSGHVEAGGGVSPTGSVSLAEHMPGRFLAYLWQLFLPPLSFMGRLFPPGWPFFQIYIRRGWASFGWYAFDFPTWVYWVIVAAMALFGVLALGALWRNRRPAKGLGWELLTIVLFPLCSLLAVEAAFFTPNGGGRVVVAEQGRYIFPAIGALAAIAIGGTFGLGRRWQAPLASVLVVAMIGLSYASQLLTLGSFYT